MQSESDNKLMTLAVKIGIAFMPIMTAAALYVGHTLNDLTDRVGKMETTMALTVPNVYPRGEALNALGTVNARIDGVVGDMNSTSHRISALEDARNRLH